MKSAHQLFQVCATLLMANLVQNAPLSPEEELKETNSKVDEIHLLVSEHVIHQANIPVSFHMRNPVSTFIGRVAEISEIKWAHADRKMVVITGPRGVGKSELARKYALELKHDNTSSTIWIDSETHDSLISSFKDLAVVVGIKIDNKSKTTLIREVIEHFSNRKTLFIFDNASEDNIIIDNLPSFIKSSNKFVSVIITSRDVNWNKEKFKILPLTHFSKEEAREYIKNTLKKVINLETNDTASDKLTDFIGYLPLNLNEALEFIIKENALNPKKIYSVLDHVLRLENKEVTPAPQVVIVTQPPITDDDIENVLKNKLKKETQRIGDQISNEAKRFGNSVSNEAKRVENRVKKWFG